VLTRPSKTLGQLKREYGREWIIGYVSMWLIELNDSSNVKTKMTDAQMEMTAERIYDGYSLKISDLTLFFRNVKEGIYGQFYERISQEKILEWLRMYFDERCEVAQNTAQQNHEGFSMTKDKVNPKIVKKMFEGVGEEEVDHTQYEKNGIGKRFKKEILNIENIAKELKK